MVRTRARVDPAHYRWADILHKGLRRRRSRGAHCRSFLRRTIGGRVFDLATGTRVCMIVSSAGGSGGTGRVGRTLCLVRDVHAPSIAPLVDYGPLGETQRFEAWRADPGWAALLSPAEQAVRLREPCPHGERPCAVARRSVNAVSVPGCPVVVPDLQAGLIDHSARRGSDGDGGRQGARNHVPPRSTACSHHRVAGRTNGRSRGRTRGVGARRRRGRRSGRRARARCEDRRTGSSVDHRSRRASQKARVRPDARDHRRDDASSGWRAFSMRRSMPHGRTSCSSRAHIPCVACTPCRWNGSPSMAWSRRSARGRGPSPLRHLTAAARRSEGLRGRFASLLFGDLRAPMWCRAPRRVRG
jgi:hypothetical protein